MAKFIEIFPLSFFLLCGRFIDKTNPENWAIPFFGSGLISLAVISYFYHKHILFNRIHLGIYIYFIIGSLSFIFKEEWVLETYSSLQVLGMLIAVLVTGFVTTLISEHGFIGVVSPNKKSIYKHSALLILTVILACITSYIFKGNKLLSEVLPFCGIFMTSIILKRQTIYNHTHAYNT